MISKTRLRYDARIGTSRPKACDKRRNKRSLSTCSSTANNNWHYCIWSANKFWVIMITIPADLLSCPFPQSPSRTLHTSVSTSSPPYWISQSSAYTPHNRTRSPSSTDRFSIFAVQSSSAAPISRAWAHPICAVVLFPRCLRNWKEYGGCRLLREESSWWVAGCDTWPLSAAY